MTIVMYKTLHRQIKELFETNYPRGSPDSYRDIEVFRSFHF